MSVRNNSEAQREIKVYSYTATNSQTHSSNILSGQNKCPSCAKYEK